MDNKPQQTDDIVAVAEDYTKLFKAQRKMYSVQDIVLPVPLNFNVVVAFVVCFVVTIFFTKFTFGIHLKSGIICVLISALVAWVFDRGQVNGRSFPKALSAWGAYLSRPHDTFNLSSKRHRLIEGDMDSDVYFPST